MGWGNIVSGAGLATHLGLSRIRFGFWVWFEFTVSWPALHVGWGEMGDMGLQCAHSGVWSAVIRAVVGYWHFDGNLLWFV